MSRAPARVIVAFGGVVTASLALGCGGKSGGGVPDADPPVPDAMVDAPPPQPDALFVPALRNPVALADDALATAALKLLGAPVPDASTPSCRACHELTIQQLRYWRALSDAAQTRCLTDLRLMSAQSARATIDCFRADPAIPGSDLQAKKLGIYSAAAHLPWFQVAAWSGYGGGTAGQEAATDLVARAGMPRPGSAAVPLTQPQWDIVAEWFARGLPLLDEKLPDDPAPTVCTPGISSEVGAHVLAMKTQGWRAINKSNLMAMHGCAGAATPLQCLATVPLARDQPYGTTWDLPNRGAWRILADVAYKTSYWTRSSASGRFIAHGVSTIPGSYIIDLQRGGQLITVSAAYDPNWFPNDSGFIFQGGTRNTCSQGVLTSNPTTVTMTEPGCTSITSINLYQHVGAINGGDHFAIDSRFVSDDGGHSATLSDPAATFRSTAAMGFVPLLYNGTTFTAKPEVTVAAPYEGDSVLSPSTRLVISRVAGPQSKQLGFVLRKVNATPNGTSYDIAAPEIARYCTSGGKPGFSYDERWVVIHHYVTAADAVALGYTGPADPAFAPYLTQGAANVYLLELATGALTRITHMKPGQYALFPHFRSDGWIYANVRDRTTNREYMVASDAALLAE